MPQTLNFICVLLFIFFFSSFEKNREKHFFPLDNLLDNIKQNKWNDKKIINKVRIDSVIGDMNRLVRRCLKALFFVLRFFTRYLYFFISFSLWSISFWFHCLFLQHCAHYVAKTRTRHKNRKCVCVLNAPVSKQNGAKGKE